MKFDLTKEDKEKISTDEYNLIVSFNKKYETSDSDMLKYKQTYDSRGYFIYVNQMVDDLKDILPIIESLDYNTYKQAKKIYIKLKSMTSIIPKRLIN